MLLQNLILTLVARPSFREQGLEHLEIVFIAEELRHVFRLDAAHGRHRAG